MLFKASFSLDCLLCVFFQSDNNDDDAVWETNLMAWLCGMACNVVLNQLGCHPAPKIPLS